MSEREPSKTAFGVAVLRAVHQLNDGEPKILDDEVIVRLLDTDIIDGIRNNPAQFDMPQGNGLRTHVVLRSRYAEDRLERAVAERGVSQFVSLGAGLDTFAYRQPAWAQSLRIFEVDQSATQQDKRQRLASAGITIPPNVEFVAIDFETTSLEEGMRASSLDWSRPTFFSWLGVMVYLSQEAIDAVFKFVLTLPHGSEIAFTFSPPPISPREGIVSLSEVVASVGEPFKTHITPQDLKSYLYNMGFSEVKLLPPDEIAKVYMQNRTDTLRVPRRTTIGSAIV